MAGEERFAADLVQTPGGGAITAIAAARLGLRTAVAAPLGRDTAGVKVREALTAEGVEIVERTAARTPTTVVFPVQGDRAMVTVDPGVRAAASDVAALQPRAVALSLDQLYAVPEGAPAYVTVGDDDARAYAGRPPALLGRACVLFVNSREALGLTGLRPSRAPRSGSARRSTRSSSRSAPTARSPSTAASATSLPCRIRSSPSTRPVPATCWQPPTSGPT